MTLTQDFGPTLRVSLAPYEVVEGESTSRVWKDERGGKHEVVLPPYCIANMSEAQAALQTYIKEFRSAFIKTTLTRSNEITKRIFDQATRVANFQPNSMIAQALDLCAASRIIERDWRFCGGEEEDIEGLGIPFVRGGGPWSETYPVTAMMDAQLDQIVIKKFLLPLRSSLLSRLEAAMTGQSPPSSLDSSSGGYAGNGNERERRAEVVQGDQWFSIFLTLAVLLSHAEWLLDHSRRNAVRMGARGRYNYLPRAEAYFHGVRTLLAHWHRLCGAASDASPKNSHSHSGSPGKGSATSSGKGSSKKKSEEPGTAPLRLGIGRLKGEEKEFVGGLEDLVRRREEELRRLREGYRYEEELYWCHQLFFRGWSVGRVGIVDVGEV